MILGSRAVAEISVTGSLPFFSRGAPLLKTTELQEVGVEAYGGSTPCSALGSMRSPPRSHAHSPWLRPLAMQRATLPTPLSHVEGALD